MKGRNGSLMLHTDCSTLLTVEFYFFCQILCISTQVCLLLNTWAPSDHHLNNPTSISYFIFIILLISTLQIFSGLSHSLPVSLDAWTKIWELCHVRIRPWILGMKTFESLEKKGKEGYGDRGLQHIHALILFCVYVFSVLDSCLHL